MYLSDIFIKSFADVREECTAIVIIDKSTLEVTVVTPYGCSNGFS